MQEVVVCGVVDPAFDGDGVVCRQDFDQPYSVLVTKIRGRKPTFMKYITERAIV